MNLDELQSVQARERQSSDLQHLRASFYREVGEFIGELDAERAAAVEAAEDPFANPDVRRLSDDIETAEQTVEAIYERRVGKVVKKASIAAAGMPVDDDGLTDEEAALFDDLVDRIERNRDTVLAALDGDASSGSPDLESPSTDAEAGPTRNRPTSDEPGADAGAGGGVSAADLMGETDGDADTGDGPDPASDAPPAGSNPSDRSSGAAPDRPAPDPGELAEGGDRSEADDHADTDARAEADDHAEGDHPDAHGAEDAGTDVGDGQADAAPAALPKAPAEGAGGAEPDDVADVPRTTVRITTDVEEIVGADDRDYDLSAEDVVTLPASNAEVLIENDAAERLE